MTVIWHNPRCSKSRQTLALLTDRGIDPVIRLYLSDGPSVPEIEAVLEALQIPAAKLMRFNETAAKELGLTKDSESAALIDAMAKSPILIERPVVISGSNAALGRPPEDVLKIL